MHLSSEYSKKNETSSSDDEEKYSNQNRQAINSSSSQSGKTNKADSTTTNNAVRGNSSDPSVKEKKESTSLLHSVKSSHKKKKEAGKDPVSNKNTKDDVRVAYRKKHGATRYERHMYIHAPPSSKILQSQQRSASQSSVQSNSYNQPEENDELLYMQLAPADRIRDQLERLAQQEEELMLKVECAEDFWVALSWIKEKKPNLISFTIDCAIGDQGAFALLDLCQAVTSIQKIRLENSDIGPKGVQALAQLVCASSTLTILNVINSNVGPQGAKAFAEVLKDNKTLLVLDLENNNIGPEGTSYLSQALKTNKTLKVLSLFDNKIGRLGAKYLGEALEENKTLGELVAYDNNIGPVGAAHLAQALEKNSSLTRLAIGKNNIGDEGVWFLCKALDSNSTLVDLCINVNNISSKGAKFLSKVMKTNTSLTVLVLGSNPLKNKGAKVLCQALEENSTLLTLDLMCCVLDDASVPFLLDAIDRNANIEAINLCQNNFTFSSVAELNARAPRVLVDSFTGPSESQYRYNVFNEIRTGLTKEERGGDSTIPDNEFSIPSMIDVVTAHPLVFPDLPSSASHGLTFSQFLAAASWKTILNPEEVEKLKIMRQFYPGNVAAFEEMLKPHIRERALLKFLLDKRTSFQHFRGAIEETGQGPKFADGWHDIAIYNAVHSIDRRAKVTYLLSLKADPNEQHPLNGTAVHALLANEVFEDDVLFFIKNFLSCFHSFNLDAKDARGNTMLVLAAKVRSTKIACFLVKQGADCTLSDKDGRTPLHCAAILGNLTLFKTFRKHNPEILQRKDRFDRTPLDYLVLPLHEREAVAEKLLLSVDIDPMREEDAIQNHILDIDWSPVTKGSVPFKSTKKIGGELLKLLETAGSAACDNIDYGDQSLVFIKAQIERFSGRSLLSACTSSQAKIRGTYRAEPTDRLPHSSCSVLNQLMQTHNINVEFQTRRKRYLPGFVDAVAALPIGKETATVKRIRDLLPKSMLMRHYKNEDGQFFSVEHLQFEDHLQALKS